MKSRRSILRTLAVTAVIPMAIGMMGCSESGGAQESSASVTQRLERVVNAKVSGLNGAFVHLSYSGPSNRAILVVLYVKSADAAAVASAVGESFKAVWGAAPFEPISIEVGAVVGERPSKPDTYNPDALAPAPILDAIRLSGAHTTDQWIDAPRSALEDRFGAWNAPTDR